jgi:hypothetical protein
MRQAEVLRTLGDAGILWIDPGKLSLYSGPARLAVTAHRRRRMERMGLPKPLVSAVRGVLKRFEPYVIPGHCFDGIEPIDGIDKLRKVRDLIDHRADPENSGWSRELHQQLRDRGRAKHKGTRMRSSAEIVSFLRGYALGLIETMERDGYDMEKGAEIGTAQIDGEGRLIKSGSGTHRFCVARALGLESFPLRVVGVHEDWVRAKAPGGGMTVDRLAEGLHEIAGEYR